jgi:hypothetical protein
MSTDRGMPRSSARSTGHPTDTAFALRHSYLIAGTHRPRNLKAHSDKRIHDMTIARNFVRYIAMPAMIGAAALGMAGMANATTSGGQGPSGPGHSFSPNTHAHPAPNSQPGWHNHHGPQHIANLHNDNS